MSKTILLIGGAGYIGTVLTESFLSKNYKVKCLDALIYSQQHCIEPFLKKRNYEFIFGDIRNYKQNKNLFKEVTDVVILAGLVGDPITKKYPKESKKINYIALKNFINECNGKKLKKVIFISTCSNYGLIKKGDSANENYQLNPLSIYAKYKIEIENYIMSLSGKVDYSPTILRFATAFGVSPRMRFDLTVNEFVRDTYNKKEIVVYDADTWRPYCHVKDFARLIQIILKSSNSKTSFQVFNVGDDKNNFTKRMLVEKISKVIKNIKVDFLKQGVDPRNYKVSFAKVKKKFSFQCKFNIDYGINELIRFFRSSKFKKLQKNHHLWGNFILKKYAKK